MLDKVTVETFAPYVGETFYLKLSEDEQLAVTLVEAGELRGRVTAGPNRKPFSLLFRPPRGQVPRQQIYRVEHATIGALEIFLVPVTPDAEGPLLEAVFS